MSDDAQPDGREHLAPLTGVRFIAALWVVLFHVRMQLIDPLPDALTVFVKRGYLGVDLFFCLSGFILAYTYTDRFRDGMSFGDYGQFLVRRLARIYPLHAFVLGLWVAAVLVQGRLGESPFAIEELVESLLLVHAWGFTPDIVWNAPSWSISAEWGAYLVFPFALMGVKKLPNSKVLDVMVSVAAYVGMAVVLLQVLDKPNLDVTHDWALVRIAGSFIAGMFMLRLRRQLADAPKFVASGLVWGSLLGLAVTILFEASDALLVPMFAPLILGLSLNERSIGRLLGRKSLVVGGQISYAVYLIHLLIFTVAKTACGPLGLTWGTYATGSLAVLGTIVAGWLLYRFVEHPARNLIVRRLG